MYDTTASYNGQQQTTWDDNETSASLAASSSTRITNTLDATELTVRKTWDDNDNEWGLRDIVYDQYRNERWSVTYKLQRSSDHGATWDWVTDGEGPVVTASITGSMAAPDAPFGSNTATFADLPAVSYTHLDVYKRQVPHRVPRPRGGRRLLCRLVRQLRIGQPWRGGGCRL